MIVNATAVGSISTRENYFFSFPCSSNEINRNVGRHSTELYFKLMFSKGTGIEYVSFICKISLQRS